jgi:excisionase family DNA binding protein
VVDLRLTLTGDQLAVLAEQVADVLEGRQAGAAPAAARWLSIDEAADYIRASRQRIYDLRSSGRLSRTGDGGRAVVDRAELDRLLERGDA